MWTISKWCSCCQIVKTLNMSSSAEYSIIKRLGDSLYTREKTKSRCLWWSGLWQHCIENMILSWKLLHQEHFQKPPSVNTVHGAICKCRLKLYQQQHLQSIWNGPRESGKLFCGWTNGNLKSFLDGCQILQTKERRNHLPCYQCSVQKPGLLMVRGCVSADGMASSHIWKFINAEM